MIRITKSPPPDELNGGCALTLTDCAAYETGDRRFEFDRNIYGHDNVRRRLREAQHAKCCYCEGRFDAHAPADVEHYRPKAAVRQDKNSPILRPGYFWLAYSWDNLYWSCQICNRSYKRNCFPLRDPEARARSHRDELSNEDPLLLDPGAAEDFRTHIQFRQEFAVGLTEVGRRTIHVVGLNRPALIEERRSRLKQLRMLLSLAQRLADEDARQELGDARLPAAVFSAMALDFLRGTELTQTEAP